MQTFQDRYWPVYVEDYHRICCSQQRWRDMHDDEKFANLMESRKSHIRSLFADSPQAQRAFDAIDQEFNK